MECKGPHPSQASGGHRTWASLKSEMKRLQNLTNAQLQPACQRPDPAEERKKYEQDLKEQIEAKKRAYEEARRKEKEDEEKLERRLREQQERMRVEYEEEDRKRRIREEEVVL